MGFSWLLGAVVCRCHQGPGELEGVGKKFLLCIGSRLRVLRRRRGWWRCPSPFHLELGVPSDERKACPHLLVDAERRVEWAIRWDQSIDE
jgi:hypothetical protein